MIIAFPDKNEIVNARFAQTIPGATIKHYGVVAQVVGGKDDEIGWAKRVYYSVLRRRVVKYADS